MKPVERVLARLEGVRENGAGWMALCPAHDDENPSLSVKEGDEGRVLMKCFAGCPIEMIAEAAGLSVADLSERNGARDGAEWLPFKTAREMAEGTPAETEWVVRRWVPKGAIVEVDGKIKAAGKTTWISHMAAAILVGQPFMGEPTAKSSLVWITEQTPSSFRRVLERAGLLGREDLYVLSWHEVAGAKWADVARAAASKAAEVGADVLLVDTLGQFSGIKGDGENNAGEALEAMKPLQEAAARGLSVVFTRHERKGGGEVGESGRGSSAFGGAVDVILSIRRAEGNTRPTVRVIESLSRFDETPAKLFIELTDDGYRALGAAGDFAAKEAGSAIVNVLPTNAKDAMTLAAIGDTLKEQGIKRTTLQSALAELMKAGTVRRTGEGRKGDPYRHYKPAPEGPERNDISSADTSAGVVSERKTEEAYPPGGMLSAATIGPFGRKNVDECKDYRERFQPEREILSATTPTNARPNEKADPAFGLTGCNGGSFVTTEPGARTPAQVHPPECLCENCLPV